MITQIRGRLVEKNPTYVVVDCAGVGPSIARTMLSSMNSEEVQNAIASENVVLIQSVKGIGAKTAQRVIVDLKDKILKTFDIDEVSLSSNNTNKEEALSALEVLGFNRRQSEKVITAILKDTPNETVELLIKKALKNL